MNPFPILHGQKLKKEICEHMLGADALADMRAMQVRP